MLRLLKAYGIKNKQQCMMLTTVNVYIRHSKNVGKKVQHIVKHQTVQICYNRASLTQLLFHTQLEEHAHCTSGQYKLDVGVKQGKNKIKH